MRPVAISVSKKTLVRGAKEIKRGDQRQSGKFTTFCSKCPKRAAKGGELECGRCWCGVVEWMRAGWSDDSSRIPDPSPDCGFAAPPRKVQHN
jgi:hypothetical protein